LRWAAASRGGSLRKALSIAPAARRAHQYYLYARWLRDLHSLASCLTPLLSSPSNKEDSKAWQKIIALWAYWWAGAASKEKAEK